MIAVLRYTNCLNDERIVFAILANKNIEILQTKQGCSIFPQVTIKVKDVTELNSILYHLNKSSDYGVRLVKTKDKPSFFERLRGLF